MTLKEKQQTTRIVELISDSFFEDMSSWIHAPKINCYAFSRGLTFPDVNNEIYAPGKIAKMKFGHGPVVKNQCDPAFIDICLQHDSLALGQKCERVSFNTIKENDGNFYMAITNFKSISSIDKMLHWHFICRTPSGLWLHKPNWFQTAQQVQWIEYGNKFVFSTLALNLETIIECQAFCFKDFFYKLEIPE